MVTKAGNGVVKVGYWRFALMNSRKASRLNFVVSILSKGVKCGGYRNLIIRSIIY